MFKLFLYISFILLAFVLYNTYGGSKKNTPNKLDKKSTAILYTKSHCPYCFKAKNLLDKLEISYSEVDLENDQELQQKLIEQTGQRTVPYIYIDQKFIGGYDQLYKLHQTGKI
jgi:glutaredoxin 3